MKGDCLDLLMETTSRLEKTEELLAYAISKLEQVARVDRTPEYAYSDRRLRKGVHYFDRAGNAPEVGSRWLTPRELAQAALCLVIHPVLEGKRKSVEELR